MTDIAKNIRHLKPSSQRKLDQVLKHLHSGGNCSDIASHKLHSHSTDIDWISIRLGRCDRAIVAKNSNGETRLIYVGPHDRYNRVVGPRLRKRLVNPWQKGN